MLYLPVNPFRNIFKVTFGLLPLAVLAAMAGQYDVVITCVALWFWFVLIT